MGNKAYRAPTHTRQLPDLTIPAQVTERHVITPPRVHLTPAIPCLQAPRSTEAQRQQSGDPHVHLRPCMRCRRGPDCASLSLVVRVRSAGSTLLLPRLPRARGVKV